ncbi:MAG: serine hydrolase [Pseudomonadales bacterium]
MKRIFLAALLILLPLIAPQAGAADETGWQPLYDLVDPALQADLEKLMAANPTWNRLARGDRMAVGLVDLATPEPRFARINGNLMMYAASLPKIAILLAAYVSLEDGSLEDTAAIRQDMSDMIRYSSNQAATRMIDRIGMQRIDQILMEPRFGLYDESRGGGLWVGKRFAKQGPRLPDPMNGISHGATVTQICRFYYLLANERLVSPAWTQQMLADMSDPGLHHKFVQALMTRAPDATLYRKSGTWKTWHSDSVWVKGAHWRNYILAAMVESPDGERIIRNLLPAVEAVLEKSAGVTDDDHGMLRTYQAQATPKVKPE